MAPTTCTLTAPESDGDLLRRARNHSADAIHSLLHRHQPALARYLNDKAAAIGAALPPETIEVLAGDLLYHAILDPEAHGDIQHLAQVRGEDAIWQSLGNSILWDLLQQAPYKEKSFRAIYTKYHRPLNGMFARLTADEHLCTESVDEAMLKLYLLRARHAGNLFSFLCTVALNHFRTECRRRNRRNQLEALLGEPAEQAPQARFADRRTRPVNLPKLLALRAHDLQANHPELTPKEIEHYILRQDLDYKSGEICDFWLTIYGEKVKKPAEQTRFLRVRREIEHQD
jgi:DNA-directed RNA polymerase specialized sigma24 family protein